MAAVAGFGQRLVQLAHQLRGFRVGRRLAPVQPRLNTEDEGERFDIVLEITEQEAPLAPFFQVAQMPALEVAGEDVARPLRFRQRIGIIQRLITGALQVQAG